MQRRRFRNARVHASVEVHPAGTRSRRDEQVRSTPSDRDRAAGWRGRTHPTTTETRSAREVRCEAKIQNAAASRIVSPPGTPSSVSGPPSRMPYLRPDLGEAKTDPLCGVGKLVATRQDQRATSLSARRLVHEREERAEAAAARHPLPSRELVLEQLLLDRELIIAIPEQSRRRGGANGEPDGPRDPRRLWRRLDDAPEIGVGRARRPRLDVIQNWFDDRRFEERVRSDAKLGDRVVGRRAGGRAVGARRRMRDRARRRADRTRRCARDHTRLTAAQGCAVYQGRKAEGRGGQSHRAITT